ncbi:MAG: F0F1 ATP synthase subunit B, partial [Mobilicoccus sp.]|nr:F0F1 ATP synthase subunit B [Mobilicoccus sp.]
MLTTMHTAVTTLPMAAGGEGGGGGLDGLGLPLIPHPSEAIFGLVLFLIFLAFVWKVVWPKMEAAYAARTEAIEGDMGRAEAALAEAEEKKRQYEQQLADARTEAAHI